jgi:hypothetical protein
MTRQAEATIPAPEGARFWVPSQSWVHRLASNVRAQPQGNFSWLLTNTLGLGMLLMPKLWKKCF